MYTVCQHHLELAIDRFVDEYEDAPDIVDLDKTRFAAWDPPAQCEEHGCGESAKYLVV